MKRALCIDKKKVISFDPKDHIRGDYILTNHKDLLNATATLFTRDYCESRPEFLQLIPYITVFDKQTNKVFVYQRGDQSQESRLHSKWSIGLGGHVEEQSKDTPESLIEVLARCAARELDEEIGYSYTEERVEYFKDKFSSMNFGMIYSDQSEVDEVHLGLSLIVTVNAQELQDHEEGVITHGQWISLEELIEQDQKDIKPLERWSKMVLGIVAKKVNIR